jgi:hypothetical protein
MAMMNYEGSDEKRLSPEQRQMLYDSLRQKYEAAGNRDGVAAAEKKANMQRMGAGLLDGFSMYTTAENGVKNPVKFDQLREKADKGVSDAERDRKEKMDAVLKGDQLDQLDKDRVFQDKTRSRTETDWKDSDAVKSRENDPASEESQMARDLAKRMMPTKDFGNMTAAELKRGLPTLEKIYSVEQGKQARVDAARERSFARTESAAERAENKRVAEEKERREREEKETEKGYKLNTPYGMANTEQDAKELREGHESKKAFDSKIQEMIALREKHNGGATFNREDVARGKQLSREALLEYKNMAKLGVLSQSDTDIVEAIIPKDPLEYNVSGIVGQDPTLANLKKFKADSDSNFEEKIKTRTRGAMPSKAAGQAPAQPMGAMHGSQLPD